jgi:ATP-binding cassette subfamily F protein 3
MSITTLENVGKTKGDFDIFRGYCASIDADEKIGLICPDAVRKSWLMRVVAGESDPTAGTIWRADGLHIGSVGRETVVDHPEQSLYEQMLAVFAGVTVQEARMRALEQQVQSGAYSQEVLDYYSRALERFQQAGGYDYEIRIGQVLNALGFQAEDRDLPFNQLDECGQRRALLARVLLAQPALLVLDEPDAGLDDAALGWLAATLRNWRGAVVLDSPNTGFLGAVANTVWELGQSGITIYRSGYGGYLRGLKRIPNRDVTIRRRFG